MNSIQNYTNDSFLDSDEFTNYSYSKVNPLDQLNDSNLQSSIFQTFQPDLNDDYEPEYLHFEPKGTFEKLSMNAGITYLSGIIAGGAYGIINGLATSPSNKFRIRVNALLNKTGRYGSKFGNALGALSVMYTFFRAGTERLNLEQYVPNSFDDVINPFVSATLTGLLYKSTQGPKTMFLGGILGGITVVTLNLSRSVFGSALGLAFI